MINLVFLSLFLNPFFMFDSVQSAQRAKASLNGADIYSGCCTLKIEYAKVTLQVLLSLKCTFKFPQMHSVAFFTITTIICLVLLQPTRLNVFKNDQDTCDYTNPNLGGPGKTFKHEYIFQSRKWGFFFFIDVFFWPSLLSTFTVSVRSLSRQIYLVLY